MSKSILEVTVRKSINLRKLHILIPVIIIGSNLLLISSSWGSNQGISQKICFTFNSSEYISHSPIAIDGNNDFLSQAASNGWTGDGSVDNPVIIETYNITSSATEHMIMILNTNLHFIIRNNFLNGVNGLTKEYGDGIWLNNVQNGQITNNTICSNKMGISFEPKDKYNLISYNIIFNNAASAIHLYQSDSNVIKRNKIYDNIRGGSDMTMQGDGIELRSSENNSIFGNQIFENPGAGIIMRDGTDNNLFDNVISFNQHGITLRENSDSNDLHNNTIFNNTINGILLRSQSNYNIIRANTISNSSSHGIAIETLSNNNWVSWNDFISNNQGGTSQGTDSGPFNTLIYNYWNERISPDENSDQYVDNAYPIDGSSNNHDSQPLTSSFTNYPERTTSVSTTSEKNQTTTGFLLLTILSSTFIIILGRKKKKILL